MTAAHDISLLLSEIRERLAQIETLTVPANDASSETLDEWSVRWATDRKRRGLGCERRRYEKWISPLLGHLPVAILSRSQVEEWVEMIEYRVLDGDLRATTAWRAWTVLRTMLRDSHAARSKRLRVRADNPLRDIRQPDRGRPRVGTFLFPSEFMRLVSCQKIMLACRRRYALSVYLYLRAGELQELRWSDIDLRSGRVHIHRARKEDGSVGAPKTGEDRQFVAEPALLPLLRAMRDESDYEYVCPGRTNTLTLRRHLEIAGCTREDLLADDERRRPLTIHDLRATGITWQAMRGDSPTAISERVGHLHLSTTEGYMRRGRLLAIHSGERVFPDLPPSIKKS